MARFAGTRVLTVSAILSALLTLAAAATVFAGGGTGPFPL